MKLTKKLLLCFFLLTCLYPAIKPIALDYDPRYSYDMTPQNFRSSYFLNKKNQWQRRSLDNSKTVHRIPLNVITRNLPENIFDAKMSYDTVNDPRSVYSKFNNAPAQNKYKPFINISLGKKKVDYWHAPPVVPIAPPDVNVVAREITNEVERNNNGTFLMSKNIIIDKVKDILKQYDSLKEILGRGVNKNKNKNDTSSNIIKIFTKRKRNETTVSVTPSKKILRLYPKDEESEKQNYLKQKRKELDNIFKWARRMNIYLNEKISFNRKANANFKATARDFIKEKTVLVEIPKEFVLSTNHPLIHPLCEKIRNIRYTIERYEKICISAFIASESNSASSLPLSGFLRYLNKFDLSSSPLFYSEDERKLLEGSFFLSLLSNTDESWKKEYKALHETHVLHSKVGEEDYYKARINVNSKFLKVKSNGYSISVVVPFAYYFNHQEDVKGTNSTSHTNAKIRMNPNGNVQILSCRNINEGHTISLNIGKLSNYQKLLFFGRVTENNKNPIEINLDFQVKPPHAKPYLAEIQLTSEIKMNSALKNCRKAAIITLKGTRPQEPSENENYLTALTLANEKEALKLLQLGLKAQMKKYKSRIIDDKEKLEELKSTFNIEQVNMRNILLILIEEKIVVNRFLGGIEIINEVIEEEEEIEKDQFIMKTNRQVLMSVKLAKELRKKKYLLEYFNSLAERLKLRVKIPKVYITDDEYGPEDLDLDEDDEDTDKYKESEANRIDNVPLLENISVDEPKMQVLDEEKSEGNALVSKQSTDDDSGL